MLAGLPALALAYLAAPGLNEVPGPYLMPSAKPLRCWRRCHCCLTPGADVVFATCVRLEKHLSHVCVPVGLKVPEVWKWREDEAHSPSCAHCTRGQNMPEFRPEKAWSKLRHIPTNTFCLFPTQECRLFKCPLNIFLIRNSGQARNNNSFIHN